MKKQWSKPTVTEITAPVNRPAKNPRYDLWIHILDVTGFTAVDDDLNAIIYLALRCADADQLAGAGLEKTNR